MDTSQLTEQLVDQLFHGKASGEAVNPASLPKREVTTALQTQADALVQRLGVSEVPADQRAPLASLSSPEDLDLDQDYLALLNDFPELARRSVPREVFANLGQTSTTLASVIAGATMLELSLLQGCVDVGTLVRAVTDRVEKAIQPGVVLPAGLGPTVVRVIFAAVQELRTWQQEKDAQSKANRELASAKRAAEKQAADTSLAGAQKVDRFKQAAKAGAPLPPAKKKPPRTRRSTKTKPGGNA